MADLERKTILFSPSLNTGGGTERVLVNLSNALISKGLKVVVICHIKGSENLYNLDSNVVVYEYWFGKLKSRYANSKLLKVINKLWGKFFLNIFLKKITNNVNTTIVSFSNNITLDCYKTTFKDNLLAFEHWPYWITNKNPKLQSQIKRTYPKLNKVIVLTEHEKKVYQNIGCRNVRVIPNAYSIFPDKQAELKSKIVLSIGHFNQQKRRDLLIETWKYVAEKHTDWKLRIIGDGHLKKDVINRINELNLNQSIEILAPTKDIYKHYYESSIYLMTSEFEALPMVLIEAKTCGLPCVSFDVVSGPNEIIRENEDGFLVDYSNLKEIANKVCILIEDEELRKKFGINSRKDALERFCQSKIYKEWDKLLNKIDEQNESSMDNS